MIRMVIFPSNRFNRSVNARIDYVVFDISWKTAALSGVFNLDMNVFSTTSHYPRCFNKDV